MLKELWERFENAVHTDDAELRAATRALIGELKSRIEAIEEQLGIVHAAPVAEPVVEVYAPTPNVSAAVAEVVAESQYVTDPLPTEVVSQPEVEASVEAPTELPPA